MHAQSQCADAGSSWSSNKAGVETSRMHQRECETLSSSGLQVLLFHHPLTHLAQVSSSESQYSHHL